MLSKEFHAHLSVMIDCSKNNDNRPLAIILSRSSIDSAMQELGNESLRFDTRHVYANQADQLISALSDPQRKGPIGDYNYYIFSR